MTYDDWKLETPEDEAERKGIRTPMFGWRGPPKVCPNCGHDWQADDEREDLCATCGIDPTIDAHGERDPDDARDDWEDNRHDGESDP